MEQLLNEREAEIKASESEYEKQLPIWDKIEKDQLDVKRQLKKDEKEKQLTKEKMRKEAEENSK